MKLRKFMKMEKMKPKALAKLLKLTTTQVNQYIDGKTIPRTEVMMNIFINTRGLVSANDFYGTTMDVLERELLKNSKRVVEN